MVLANIIIAIVMMVISYAISYAMMPKSQNNDATIGEADVPTAESGKTIPVVFGTMLLKDANVIDYFDPKVEEIKSEGGGK